MKRLPQAAPSSAAMRRLQNVKSNRILNRNSVSKSDISKVLVPNFSRGLFPTPPTSAVSSFSSFLVVFGHQTKCHLPLTSYNGTKHFSNQSSLQKGVDSSGSQPLLVCSPKHKANLLEAKHFFRLLAAPPAAALLGNMLSLQAASALFTCTTARPDNGGIASRMAPETYTRVTAAMI